MSRTCSRRAIPTGGSSSRTTWSAVDAYQSIAEKSRFKGELQ